MQLEVLKSQIDPHFMFNNFSILSELIMEDRTLADKFLEHLSKVYRYVIQNLKRDIVSIQEEITFLYSYMYLIDIRYENAVRINVDNKLLKDNDGCIPPICLQLLVENAIKHNQFSASHPWLYVFIGKKIGWWLKTSCVPWYQNWFQPVSDTGTLPDVIFCFVRKKPL